MLAHVYGVGPEDNHPDRCQECRLSLKNLESAHASMLPAEEPSYQFLAAQRRAIYYRLETPRTGFFSFRLTHAVAAAAMLVFGFMLSVPKPVAVVESPVAAVQAESEGRFYTNLYAEISSEIPSSVGPIQELFEQ
jgi:hypothetical protein